MRRILLVAALCLGLLAPALAVVQPITSVGNTAYTILPTDQYIFTSVAFSTSRTWTLPSAGATCIGQTCASRQLTIIDRAAAITSSNTLVIARPSGETINGAASDLTVNYAGATIALIPTSGSNWQAIVTPSANAVAPLSVTTFTADAINGGDASLGINGLAAAQGGAIVVTGGTSSTAGNVGGAVSVVGGTPGATSAGGAVSITGGIGGATSGAGGKASVVGGAATASNSAGGAAELIGGAGSGSSAGGAITITSGAAGATGVAGAVNVAVGAATAGNGSAVTISGGNGAGGTASGGDVDLVPGDAVSTGIPGMVKINGDANLICASFVMYGAPAAATDTVFFIATRPLIVTSVSALHAVAAGGVSTLQVTKDTGTAAPGAGTDLLTAAIDLNATANTIQSGSITTVVADKTLAAGNRLAVDFANAIQSTSGVTVTACMAPL